MTAPVHVINQNYRFAYKQWSTLAQNGDVARFGPIIATTSGTDIASYNRIFALDTVQHDGIEDAAELMDDRDLPFSLIATGEHRTEAEEIATSLGLVETKHTEPGMVLPSLESIPDQSSDVAIEVASDADTLAEMREVFTNEFGFPAGLARYFIPSAALDEESITYLVGRIERQIVSTGALITHDDSAGIYLIGTVEDFRGKGIGTDITWESLRLGREGGCQVGVLQSTEMGYSVYKKMGFEPVVDYLMFKLPSG